MAKRPEVTGRHTTTTEVVPRAAYTIPEFCEAHRISQAFYYKIRNLGLGPREGRTLGKITISMEAAADWRKQQETIQITT
jgi:hypothetical protein